VISTKTRIAIGVVSLLGLIIIFLGQKIHLAQIVGVANGTYRDFVINRSFRFIMNDILALGVIYALFPYRKYIAFAGYVHIAGLILFLIPYFFLRYYANLGGPLLNFLHRIILNPVLMLLLIPSFYFLKHKKL
jgi:exosortase F-associated protein